MLVNANIKNMRTISLPQFQSLVALLFKDEGVLANHPLSYHPQGVVGRQESERKGEKMRKAGKLELFTPKVLLMSSKVVFGYNSVGAYVLPQPSKITKRTKIKSYYKG